MSLYAGGETILIHRKTSTSVDAYGNATYSATTLEVTNVLVAFDTTNEPVEVDRNPIDAKLTLYMPAGTAIEDADEFQVRGSMWVKDGIAKDWGFSTNSFDAGVVVSVRKRIG